MSERLSGSEIATIAVVVVVVGFVALSVVSWVIGTVFFAIKLIIVVVAIAIAWRAATAVLGAGSKRKELGR
ncbi:MAG: hypothetical protein QOF21_629 [Actinomycetota bacterium]|jgi:hypothetical protein